MTKDAEAQFYENLGRWAAQIAEEKRENPLLQFSSEDVAAREFGWNELRSTCDSPIEELLAAEILFITDGYTDIKRTDELLDFGTTVTSQGIVGRNRCDFLFVSHHKGRTETLVVECDGHDFHERTKEQARRDKSRDRRMTSAGVTVLRFTGSEIYRDARACAEEIESVLAGKMSLMVEGRKPHGL